MARRGEAIVLSRSATATEADEVVTAASGRARGIVPSLRRISFAMLLAVALGSACTAFSGSDGAPGVASDGGPAADAGALDGATRDCDVSIPSGSLVASARFDEGNCDGWDAKNGRVEAVTTMPRCGAGACRVCVTAAGDVDLRKGVPVVKDGGSFQLDLSVRNETAATWGAFLFLDGPTGDEIEEEGSGGEMTTAGWTPGQVVARNPGTTSRVRMVLRGTGDAGQCLVFDEVSLVHY